MPREVERGFDKEFARDEVHGTRHRDFLRLARSFDPRVRAPPCQGTGEMGMARRFRFIGKKQHHVPRLGALFHQLQPRARAVPGPRILAAFQSVAGPLAGKAPFLRGTAERREREMRGPVRRSISSGRRGSVRRSMHATPRA